jgi:hypothetical protein
MAKRKSKKMRLKTVYTNPAAVIVQEKEAWVSPSG